MKITKRQLKRIIREEYSRLKRRGLIRESINRNAQHMECLQALKDWSGDWEYSQEEVLDFFMNDGEHLIDYLADIDPSELSQSGNDLLEFLKAEFGLFDGYDGY